MTPTEPRVIELTAEPPRASRVQAFAATVLAMTSGGPWSRNRPRRSPPTRPCIVCGEPNTSNNAFCSADCCRLHRDEAKRIRERT